MGPKNILLKHGELFFILSKLIVIQIYSNMKWPPPLFKDKEIFELISVFINSLKKNGTGSHNILCQNLVSLI